jgi:hypothetical protein
MRNASSKVRRLSICCTSHIALLIPLTGPSKDIQALNLYDPLIALPKIADPEGADAAIEREESGTPVPLDIKSGPGLRASARQKNKEHLEKRKAMTQDVAEAQRSTKQPRVEET